jgi:hypothetical protein
MEKLSHILTDIEMEIEGKPFEQDQYQKYDPIPKKILWKIMLAKEWNLLGDVRDEHFRDYDIAFQNGENGHELRFENEVRPDFERIRREFPTIHILFRKRVSKAHYYVIWHPKYTQIGMASLNDIRLYENDPKIILCRMHDGSTIQQKIIDVPKSHWIFYWINEQDKLIKI